jgi:Protein of unknown function (DUF2628)
MTIYTVHAPPPKDDEVAPDPERFVFVRDGFYLWAFVFGPVWLLFKRLWLSLLIYVAAVVVLQVGLWLLRAPPPTHALVSLMMHLLLGLEAATVRRWTFNRRHWTQLGVVSGANPESAERRFFDVWVTQMAWRSARATPTQTPPNPQVSAISPGMSQGSSDIIGLFPEPQPRQ